MRVRQFSNSLSVALSQDHWDQIKKITDERQISMAQWVREAVAAALDKIQQEEDLKMTNKDIALSYLQKGLSVIPLWSRAQIKRSRHHILLLN